MQMDQQDRQIAEDDNDEEKFCELQESYSC